MGISRLTAYQIVESEFLIFCSVENKNSGKYEGWITYPSGRPLLNTKPVFDSAKEAVDHVKDLKTRLKEIIDV